MSPTPHLDDERLSALFDGEATAQDEQHAMTCSECGVRLAAWRRALGAVAIPPAPADTTERDAAVGAALAAAAAPPTALDGTATRPVVLSGRRRRHRGGPIGFRVATAVAAVIVIAGIAVAVAQRGRGGSAHPSAAAGRPPASATVPQGSSSAAGINAAPAPPARADLGSYQDPGALVGALRARLHTAAGAQSAPGPPPAAVPAPSPCLGPARRDAGVPPQTSPVLQATLTYRGSPAQVFVFNVPGGRIAALVGVPGCPLLTVAAL